MIINFKTLFIFVGLSIYLGMFISPFAAVSPQQILISPINTIKAKEDYNQKNNMLKIKKSTPKTIANLFTQLDKQQEELQNLKVLGANDDNQEDSTQTNPISMQKTIAFFGDSMIDTMETNLPYLSSSLKTAYPNGNFMLLNYGIGAQSATAALARLDSGYQYKDRDYGPILQSGADIFVVESFAYNPMDNIDEYDQALRSILNRFQSSGKPVYFLASIAPLKSNFGKGPGGVNWDSDTAWNHATKINEHMERGIAVARNLNIPIIDCYHSTLQSNGEGISNYVNTNDGIHASVAGHKYIANMIAQKIGF